MQAVLARLDAMDIGEPHFRLWLRVAAEPSARRSHVDTAKSRKWILASS
jgi:hypothetical protein